MQETYQEFEHHVSAGTSITASRVLIVALCLWLVMLDVEPSTLLEWMSLILWIPFCIGWWAIYAAVMGSSNG